jgi:hypothetical protein
LLVPRACGDLEETAKHAIKWRELKAKFLMISASYFVRGDSSAAHADAHLI